MNIALFTKCFLEPTHVAIAQVLRAQPEHTFRIFAKAYDFVPGLEVANAIPVADLSRQICSPASVTECDVIHAIYDGHIAFDAFQLSERTGRPFILSFHGGFDTNVKIWKPKLREMTRAMIERASIVTVVGESDLQRLRGLGVKRTIDIIPVPVDCRMLPVSAPPAPNELIAVGRLVPKKGYDTAIEAMAHMPERYILKIVGSGPEENGLRSLAQRLGVADRVRFFGFLSVSEMLRELSQSEVFLHPARIAEDGNADGTPQAILWAQALGIPVIAGDSGSIRDVVVDRVTGRIVPPNDAQGLAAAALEILNEKVQTRELIMTASQRIREKHDLRIVVDSWRRLYTQASSSCPTKPIDNSLLLSGRSSRFCQAFNAALTALGVNEDSCSLIESGGQGVIFHVRSKQPDSSLILKVANYHGETPTDVLLATTRLRKEGEVLVEVGKLGCNVVPRSIMLDPEGRFLVREYVCGPTIQDAALNLSPAERARLLPVLLHSCSALFRVFHQASPQPYVIRDLKPKNLVLTDTGGERIMLIDVGSARPAGRQAKSARSKVRLGTRNWLHWAPELLLSQGIHAEQRSDLFSLGATAFYLLLAYPPYSNSEPDASRAFDRYVTEYAEVCPAWLARCETLGVPGHIGHFIASCLNPLIDQRPSLIPQSE